MKNFRLFILWLGVILYLSFMPMPGWPQVKTLAQLGLDKLVHITMYAILCLLLLRSLFFQSNNHAPHNKYALAAVMCCAATGIVIEWLQPMLTQFRKLEGLDMIANSLGAIGGYFIFLWMARKEWLGMRRHPA